MLVASVVAFTFATFDARMAFGQKKPKLPELKSLEQKLQALEFFRNSLPTKRVGSKLRFTPDDLDRALLKNIEAPTHKFAKPISDELFLKRAFLDVAGKIPAAHEVEAFGSNPDRRKRAKLVDYLLNAKEYARKWARYWTDVIFYNSNANKNRINRDALEDWLAEAFEKDVPWDRITAALVSASPKYNKNKKKEKNDWGQKEGYNNFVLACENQPGEIAAQTARIFMGISIQCAECHDHPFDQWEREQFHEMAAFFARGSYSMPDQDDPKKKIKMKPRFLLGEEPPSVFQNNADARRVAVAAYLIYNPNNYWFARAYVNRIWNELVGDGFYSVDSLGPDAEVTHKLLVNRMGAMFRYKAFDPKWVFRLIMNSQVYQREMRTIESDSELFTAVRPTRLRPDQVVASVERIADIDSGLTKQLNSTFDADPSIPQRDLEGSIQQALLMMNHPKLNEQLQNSELKKELLQIESNQQLIEQLYLGILARRSTDNETARGMAYLRKTTNRSEAVDDLMWVLVNSTEFLTKR
ncbi:MAG: hypothetical protein CMJ78_21655 [Planctomycetaceae bacterium]|nr:hypothetical protein [Planctomycetaceae bacterium]